MIKELDFENQLLRLLTKGESQWTYREDITTEDALWQNIRKKINQNNVDKLEGEPLTEQEFNRIKEQINFASFYQAGEWLKGENGHVSVEIQRGQKRLRLEVLNQNEITGGSTSYEVIHQLSVEKREHHFSKRRLDVTLLFNGLPLIHIELKGPRTSRKEAFNQINKYIKEGVFKGALSMVQMFVVMNEGGAQYIAAPKQGELLNPKFLTSWLDKDNHPIHGGLNFAKEVLSIPQAHHMISDYMVLDSQSKALILLRPYQIQAIQQIYAASKEGKSGFVWHTTGSGKTLTSYKVARNLLKIPSMNKTIFLVDRRDLDDQTFTAYDAYSKNDPITVKATNHTQTLLKQLLSKERHLIITTRQKLDNIMRQANAEELPEKQVQKLRDLKLAFVVDECHRTLSSEKQRLLQRFFSESLWYGFTGTPIFADNKKDVKGDLAATTEQQYGPCLHQYTVKEAIHDGSVLGFKMDYQTTIDEETTMAIVQEGEQTVSVNSENMAEIEGHIPKVYFEKDTHKLEVIHAIVNKSRKKFGMFPNSGKKNGEFYAAILTTSSIKEAQRYYELFQEVIRGESEVKISEETKRYAPDFPKVAITYSVSENEDNSIQNQEKMRQSIADYNKMFGTDYQIDQMDHYNRNLNERLARKKNQYLKREKQLDIVIVVDRLLTGFDAPCIANLFIDRAPQKPQDLIQAFSRTNRIFDEVKRYGNVTTFRTPNLFKVCVDRALRLYSSGGEGSVLAPTFEETESRFKKAIEHISPFLDCPQTVYDAPLSTQKAFISACREVNSAYHDLVVYDEYDQHPLTEYGVTIEQLENLEAVYIEVLEQLKEKPTSDDEKELLEIDYEWTPVHTEEINYEYILNLMQQVVSTENKLQLIDDQLQQEVEAYIRQLSHEKEVLAQYLQEIWQNILDNPYQYKEQNIHQILSEKLQEKEAEYIQSFANRWYVNESEVRYAIQDYDKEEASDSADLKQLAEVAAKNYKAQTESSEKPLKLKKRLKQEFKQLMSDYIEKLY